MNEATKHADAETASPAETAILEARDLVRRHMGEGRHVVALVELIEAAAEFEVGRFNGDKEAMLDAASSASSNADALYSAADDERESELDARAASMGNCGRYSEEIGPWNTLDVISYRGGVK